MTRCSRASRKDVAGQQVVLDDAAVLRPVGAEDDVIILVQQFRPTRGFAALHVLGLLGRYHRTRDAQSDDPIDGTTSAGDLAVVVVHGDFVAEEPRRLGAGVRDEGLLRRQFQPEFVTDELCQPLFDFLGFCLRSGEPEQGVVGVTRISQSPVARIMSIHAGHTAKSLAQLPHLGAVIALACASYGRPHPMKGTVRLPDSSPGVFRDQNILDVLIHLVQIDI